MAGHEAEYVIDDCSPWRLHGKRTGCKLDASVMQVTVGLRGLLYLSI